MIQEPMAFYVLHQFCVFRLLLPGPAQAACLRGRKQWCAAAYFGTKANVWQLGQSHYLGCSPVHCTVWSVHCAVLTAVLVYSSLYIHWTVFSAFLVHLSVFVPCSIPYTVLDILLSAVEQWIAVYSTVNHNFNLSIYNPGHRSLILHYK